MNKEQTYRDLLNFLSKDQIKQDEPMRNHTTFKIGGPVDFLVIAKSKEDIKKIYSYAQKENIPFYIIGKASNLLVKDKGIRGIVVKNCYDSIEIFDEEGEFTYLEVGSGTSIGKVTNFALENSLEGLEFSFGIPATIGGCVRMNAGAYGGEFKEIVVESLCLDKDGNERILNFDDHKFVYRNSAIGLENYIVLSTKIKLKKGNKEQIKEKMDINMKSRISKQPYNMPSAGSVFKRGNGFITAAIIEEAGLKGYKVGDACVSEKHSGFIVNNGNATAEDIINLIKEVKRIVKEKFDKELETEVIIIGE